MLFVGTHHKTGTQLLLRVCRDIGAELGLKFFEGWQRDLPADTDIWFMLHSRVDATAIPNLRGAHLVRHPLNLLCSGYRYHRECTERWCISTEHATGADGIRYDFEGLTYQQKLNSVPTQEGIRIEMRGRSYNAIMDMYAWDYANPDLRTWQFEEVMSDFDGAMSEILTFLGLPESMLDVARRHDVKRMSLATRDQNAHVTDKDGTLSWERYFTPELLEEFRAMYPPDLFARLGYAEPVLPLADAQHLG
ncbi:MAG: hypothetical protein QOD74_3110 [Variibacter sp.]|jgi:hypothetical protein|nr:hypothetical protein [Variibacter sp.]